MGRGTVAPQNVFLEQAIRSCNEAGTNFLVCNARLADYPIVYCSDTFVHLLGYRKSHVLERGGLCHFLHGDQTQREVVDSLRVAMQDRHEVQREAIFYHRSGNPLWLLIRLMVIRDDDDMPILFLLTFRDIGCLKEPILKTKKGGWAALFPKGQKASLITQATQKHAAKTRSAQLANVIALDASLIPPRYSSDSAKPSRYTILHYSTTKTIWDWFILVLTLYTSIAVPFAVSFHHVSTTMSIIDTAVDVMFILDIVFNFRTTFVDKNGNIIMTPKLIRKNYLNRWFVVDVIAAVPYSVITLITANGVVTELFGVVKVVRLMRLSRVARKLDYYLQFGATTLVLWICAFCLCAHWMACVWYVIGFYYDKPSKKWGWLYHLSMVTEQPYNYINGTLVEGSGPTVASLYMSALYYTMSSLTTCGFGNIAPTTTAEKLFGCVTMLLGCVLYAFIFGQVTSIIQQLQRQSSIFHQTLSNMKSFIKLYKIPQSLAMRIIDYYVSTWAINKGVDVNEILKECPKELQADVCVHIHRPIFDNVDVFIDAPLSALSAIGRHFRSLRTAPGDRIIQNGESLDVLYFIGKGSLEVKLRDEIYGILGCLDSFGSVTDTEFEQAIYDVHAMTYCDLHCINKVDLHEALVGYPDYFDTFLGNFKPTFNLGKTRETITSSRSMMSVRERDKNKSIVRFSAFTKTNVKKDRQLEEVSSLDNAITDLERDFNDGLPKTNDGHESPNLEVLSGLKDLKGEVRTEIARINSKMGIVEEQVAQVLKLLRNEPKSVVDRSIHSMESLQSRKATTNDDDVPTEVATDGEQDQEPRTKEAARSNLPFWLSKS